MQWGLAVKTARQACKLTQAQLGLRVGWSQSDIARLERQPDMLVSTLELLAAGLDVTCEELARTAAVNDEGEEADS